MGASGNVAITDFAGVFTYHNDLARDGTNTHEFALTVSNVNGASFGKRFSCPVDGYAYAQPLWVPALSVNGSTHNVIFVATEHDSLFAFDGDVSPCMRLWQVSLLGAGETTVPTADVGVGNGDIRPEIGITGTPVIDPASNTLYVVSKSEGPAGTFHQRLHALDLATSVEKFGGPVDIAASVAGNGDGSGGGNVAFNAQGENQRSGLALVNGVVYVAWASHEDANPYHGWVIGYSASTLQVVNFYNSTPNGDRGGIWMAGGAPAADSAGNVFVSTGNGAFDGNSAAVPNNDFGDSVLRLNPAASLSLASWFTPYNQATLDATDSDLASGGVMLLPDQSSSPAHLLVAGGKQGRLYLLNRDAMGQFCAACTDSTGDTNVVQTLAVPGHLFSTPAFWQNALYVAADGATLSRYSFSGGAFNAVSASQSAMQFAHPGPTPSISSQDASAGIVWVIDSSQSGPPVQPSPGPAVLHAFDATNLASELWNSAQATGNRDQAGNAVKFSVPTVANGKVYVGTSGEIDVYGLLP